MRTIVENQRKYFNSNVTKDISFRKQMLRKLLAVIDDNEKEIYKALKEDLNKSEYEAYMTEVQIVKGEIKTAIKSLEKWSKAEKVKTPITHFPAKSYIYKEPYGVVLVLSPWNYPFQLALAPLVGAIAAGNCVVLKTSPSSEKTSKLIEKLINETFEQQYIYCVKGEYSYETILDQKYDLIFFTGSERVGKIIMEAASKYVTPVVLELGGKSPCIIDKHANIEVAAKRIVWGKFLNAGQTCVAPDYVLIHQDVKEKFIQLANKHIKEMYGDALNNKDYPKIINKNHFERLSHLIAHETQKVGGRGEGRSLKIEPTLFIQAKFEDEVMKEEIFGPILPIIGYQDIDKVIDRIKERPKPLALYIFSEDKAFVSKINHEISFGGGCVNDVIMHLANEHLPFGGVGSSGMGSYHGEYSFKTFSHQKSMLKNKSSIDIPLRYQPYLEKNLKLMKRILK